MNYKELLCIGGPKDGQMMPIRHGINFLRVPVISEPECVALSELATPPENDVTIDVMEYRREWLRDFDGTIFEVLLASGVNNPIKRLLVEYKPKNDSAGDAGIDRFTRDLIQQHAQTDTGSKHYDRFDYLPQMREAMAKWEIWLQNAIA